MNIIYTIIIYPIEQIIELFYFFIFWILKNHGLTICFVSISVNIISLPLYIFADKLQKKEQNIKLFLSSKIKKIKSVFHGDEQYLILSTLYRQNNYHPIYTLRSSLGFLLQIPFFIAAYNFLSTFKSLNGISFLFINNLLTPDGLLRINSISINILPIIMTIINLFSTIIYSLKLSYKDKLPLYGISLIFLILLYNSPACLVIYWIMNNIFSLFKNILLKLELHKKIYIFIIGIFVLLIDIYLIFIHKGKPITRLLFSSGFTILFILTNFLILLFNRKKNISSNNIITFKIFLLSIIILTINIGLVIPGNLIASSVKEFSFIEQYSSPFPFIINIFLQSFGLILLWPLIYYFLSSKEIKYLYTIIISLLSITAVCNTFLIKEKFGFLTTTMLFSEASQYKGFNITVIFNICLILFILIFIYIIFKYKKIKLLSNFNLIIIFSLSIYGIYHFYIIYKDFTQFKLLKNEINETNSINESEQIYNFSTKGKNIVLIMADNMISGFLPIIFEEFPEFKDVFSGWTYYPNTVSFGNHTLVGALPIYGGYEYTPININRNSNITLLEKQKEAYLLLPRIFSEAGYNTIVTDPPFDNYLETNMGIFTDYPDINAKNLLGKYTLSYMQNNPDITGQSITNILKRNLLFFSFFKCAPIFFRMYIYDLGDWLAVKQIKNDSGLTNEALDAYVLFNSLSDLSSINNLNINSFFNIYEPFPHSNFYLQAPKYVPASEISDFGKSIYAKDDFYHVNIASYKLLGKWISFLKDNNLYDNTRIIIVSDHGRGNSKFENNFNLPDGSILQSFNPLLLFKDFNSSGELQIDNTFMTNADVPSMLLKGLNINKINPFTGKDIISDKNNGAYITTISALSSRMHTKFKYKIDKNQWLHVNDDIFNLNNWSSVQIIE